MAEMWKPQPKEVYVSWVDAIREEVEDKLTDWERNFIDSIDERLTFGLKLTERQAEILERIYAEKTK